MTDLIENPRPIGSATCQRCPAVVAWTLTETGKRMLVDWESLSPEDKVQLVKIDMWFRTRPRPGPAPDQVAYRRGEHRPHWADCPGAEAFRKPKSKAKDNRFPRI